MGDDFKAKFAEFEALRAPDDGRPVNSNRVFYNEHGYPGNAPFRQDGWMPIFYLPDPAGDIESFGLAFMFKLAHEQTTHDLLAHSTPDHLDEKRLDLPSLIFGATADRETGLGLKRRAVFDVALGTLPTGRTAQASVAPTVLLGPKPSYYPIYVRQPIGRVPGELPGYRDPISGDWRRSPYATFTPLDRTLFEPAAELKAEHKSPELAGVKIWPTDRPCRFPNLPAASNDVSMEVQTRLWALPTGTKFTTALRFHNLRPVELGAVLWVLTFGRVDAKEGQRGYRHRIGMGKPYAMGEISICIRGATIIPNQGPVPMMADLVGEFTAEMDRASKALGLPSAWNQSAQIRALLKAAAAAQNRQTAEYEYMKLGRGGNPDLGTYRREKAEGHFLPAFAEGAEFSLPEVPGRNAALIEERTGGSGPDAAHRDFFVGMRVIDTRWNDAGVITGEISEDGRIPVEFSSGVGRMPVSRLRKE